MMNLLKNEWIKIFAKKSSWIYFILIALFITIAAVGTAYFESLDDGTNTNADWKQTLEQENASLAKDLEDPNIPDEEKESISGSIAQNQYYLDNDVNPNQRSNWQFANSAGIGLTSFVALFSVIIASANVASEFSDGTIKQLLIRPHRRWKILLSKYIAAVVYSLLLLLFLTGASILAGTFLYGAGDFGAKIAEIPMTFDAAAEPVIGSAGGIFFKKILLYIPNLIVVTTIAFMLSTLFKSQAMAVGIGIFVLFMNDVLSSAVQLLITLEQEWAKLLLFPHLNLMQYAAADEILPGVTLTYSSIVMLVYYLIFMAITFFFFQRKDVSI
ncbi:ABC transporter permease subunit [Metabacillus sp. 84]|uniref:ABC transporter permease subunit n=1 Tax=unclassified Metabacillus TaxID=2675274 RepID=UPI003CE83046